MSALAARQLLTPKDPTLFFFRRFLQLLPCNHFFVLLSRKFYSETHCEGILSKVGLFFSGSRIFPTCGVRGVFSFLVLVLFRFMFFWRKYESRVSRVKFQKFHQKYSSLLYTRINLEPL